MNNTQPIARYFPTLRATKLRDEEFTPHELGSWVMYKDIAPAITKLQGELADTQLTLRETRTKLQDKETVLRGLQHLAVSAISLREIQEYLDEYFNVSVEANPWIDQEDEEQEEE
jgi:hypothetical protein